MRKRIIQLGATLTCAAAFAAQVVSDGVIFRLPTTNTEDVSLVTAESREPPAPLLPMRSEPIRERNVVSNPVALKPTPVKHTGRSFDSALAGTVFGQESSGGLFSPRVRLVDYEENADDRFPPLTLPDPYDNPTFTPPIPGTPEKPVLQESNTQAAEPSSSQCSSNGSR